MCFWTVGMGSHSSRKICESLIFSRIIGSIGLACTMLLCLMDRLFEQTRLQIAVLLYNIWYRFIQQSSCCRKHQLAFCDAIIERNNRMVIPAGDSSGEHSTTSQYLESYFPFDPYLLVR